MKTFKMFKLVPSKKTKRLCIAYRCSNEHSPKDRFCSKHSKRYQKYKNPYKYAFHQKKYRAIERGIEWKLTLDEFIEFCDQNNYMETKGKTKTSASIDRIDPNKGYEIGNLQILSLSENSKKMHRDNSEDCPF